MKSIFYHRPAKVEQRKRFERRIWKNEKVFSDYYYDKVILASQVPIDEEELIDYLIDSIPKVNLRNQACIQCFKKEEEILRAFEKVTLRPDSKNRSERAGVAVAMTKTNDGNKRTVGSTSSSSLVGEQCRGDKCFNCNKPGHLARNCDKPKREKNSCCECGSMEHIRV